jgi:hypothetical protein
MKNWLRWSSPGEIDPNQAIPELSMEGSVMQSAKEIALQVIGSLPDDCTLDDISYRLYLRSKLERADRAIEEGRVHSFEEGREIVQSWFTSSGPTQP